MNRERRRHPERFINPLDILKRRYKSQEECWQKTGLYPISISGAPTTESVPLQVGDIFTTNQTKNRRFILVADVDQYLITGKIYGRT